MIENKIESSKLRCSNYQKKIKSFKTLKKQNRKIKASMTKTFKIEFELRIECGDHFDFDSKLR